MNETSSASNDDHATINADAAIRVSTADAGCGNIPTGVSKPYLLPKESPMHVPPHVAMARIDDDVERLKIQIRFLQERNFIKDKGKKFEGSYTRVSFIMLITYATISAYMYLIGVKDPLLNAIVPAVGFNLSTWSLPWLKKVWMAFYDWNYGKGRNHMTLEEFEDLERVEMGFVS